MPDASLSIISDDARLDWRRFEGQHVKIVPSPERPSRASRRFAQNSWPVGRLLYPNEFAAMKTVRELLKNADALVVTGGDIFSSDYGDMERHLDIIREALDKGVQVFMHAHSVGVFSTRDEAASWVDVARRCRLVTLRENASMKYLRDEVKYDGDNLAIAADPAFLLEPAPASFGERCRSMFGINGKDRPIVAVGASEGVSSFAGADGTPHFQFWIHLVDAFVSELNAHVILIPHVQERWVGHDDRALATRIANACNRPDSVHLVGGDYNASQFKALIAGADFVIAERMHACIAGLSSCVPTLAIGYSIKARGIMNDLFDGKAEELGTTVPLKQLMESKNPAELVLRVFENAQSIHEQLATAVPAQRESASRGFLAIAKMLGER